MFNEFFVFLGANKIIAYMLFSMISILFLMFFILFVQYNIDRSNGKNAKFLWFEANIQDKASSTISPPQTPSISSVKNMNTGINNGHIGDETYTGIKQRYFSSDDGVGLLNSIEQFKINCKMELNLSHITIGYPGDKETMIVANQICEFLKSTGYEKIEIMHLITQGVIGKMYQVSNAPDNSIMIMLFPADNVE